MTHLANRQYSPGLSRPLPKCAQLPPVPTENSISAKKGEVKQLRKGASLGLQVGDCFARRGNGNVSASWGSGSCRRPSSAPIIRRARVSGGPTFVAVMQPPDLGQRHDPPHVLRLDRSRLGRVLAQGEMGSRSVIVIQIRTKDTTKRGFLEHDHMVQALPPNGTNHPLDVSPLPGGSRSAVHFLDAHVSHLSPEGTAEDRIAVAQQGAWQLVEGEGLAQLLSGPLRGRVPGHVAVENAPTVMGQNQKDVKHLETEGGHGEEVDGDQLGAVIVQEGPPGLRGRPATAYDV